MDSDPLEQADSRLPMRLAREQQAVPASARASTRRLRPRQRTLAYLQAFHASPLTDSNRRPLLAIEVINLRRTAV